MPKRIGRLWDSLVSFENLLLASQKARRGKRRQANVERFEFELEGQLVELAAQLSDRTYRPGPFHSFQIRDPKPRTISAAPYIDRIVHHAFCNVVEPIFERSFIHDSYACRAGKGSHAAVDRYAEFARRHRYVLKCDVRKFFPSVDHQVVLSLLERKIKDKGVLWLARTIINHANVQEPVPGYFPGDDLFTQSDRPRGLPIGNQTSQFFGNLMLDPLDHFVKQQLRCRAYVRYADDFVILDDDKRRLAEIRDAAEQFLWGLRLWLHPKKRVISRTEDGIRFLGYRVWPRYRRLPQDNVHAFRRRLRIMQRDFAVGRCTSEQIGQRVSAWVGHAQHANTYGLRRDLLRATIFVRSAVNTACPPGGRLEQQRPERSLGQP